MNELRDILRREIETCGAISFARFMELSLYCPGFGYYERIADTPGRQGDFYTSVSVGGLFGELLAFQFASWVEAAAWEEFQLLEAGAHDGRLAQDVLNWFAARRPDLFDRLEYWILEPSPGRQQWQKRTLHRFASQVRWFDSLEMLPPTGVQGVIFANELLDALPVHRLGWDANTRTWFECGVAVEEENFVWTRMPAEARSEVRNPKSLVFTPDSALRFPHREELQAVLPDGFTTEVSPAAAQWWQRAASFLRQGRLLTFDYGLTAEEFFSPERARGTLRAYHRHRLADDLLANVGQQDLTAHVHFTEVQAAGESAGLKTEGLFSQAEFLTRIAESAWKVKSGFGDWTSNRTRQFQTLAHPEHLGRRFKVLIQTHRSADFSPLTPGAE